MRSSRHEQLDLEIHLLQQQRRNAEAERARLQRRSVAGGEAVAAPSQRASAAGGDGAAFAAAFVRTLALSAADERRMAELDERLEALAELCAVRKSSMRRLLDGVAVCRPLTARPRLMVDLHTQVTRHG